MKERDLWQKLRKGAEGHWERLETKTPGYSDCIYTKRCKGGVQRDGWLELKYIQEWPVKAATNFGLKSEQALFLNRWSRAGGRADLLVGVGQEYFLFPGSVALTIYQKIVRPEALDLCLKHWEGHINWDEFNYLI